MLAQNFQSASDLDISEQEHAALITVLGMLERNELVHHIAPIIGESGFAPTIPNGFNMECSGAQTDCGTMACIGGWVAILMGRRDKFINQYVNTRNPNSKIGRLYWGCTGSATTVEQAATALRNFLTDGDARWNEVIA